MIGSERVSSPSIQGHAISPIRRREDSCTSLTFFRSPRVKWAVMAGMIAAVMQGKNAVGKLKMV